MPSTDSPSAATEPDTSEVVGRLVAGLAKGMAYVTALASPEMFIEWVSPSVRDLTGWSAEQLIGANALDFVHPDDIAVVARLVEAERNDPHPYGVDPARLAVNRIRFRSFDGGWRSLDIAANNQMENPAVRGFVFIMSDTTVQRLKDDIFDAMASGEPIGVIASKVAELLSWQTERSFVQATARGLAEEVAGEHRAGTVLITAEIGDAMVAVEHPADAVPSEWFRLLLDRAVGLLHVAVTRHHGEQALRRRIDEKTAIISAVSHDLRSPIAAIQLMSTLLDGNGDTLTADQRRQLVTRINADAQRTSRLLADLTSADRLLHGAVEPTLQRVAILPLVSRVIDELDDTDRRVTLVPPGDVAHVHADPVLTERIVDNLVANAIKHTPPGARIEVTVCTTDTHVAVHVDDDGAGVPEHHRAAIFDAYVRGDGSGPRPGSGMGLFLVRTFAEVQRGSVWCDESPLGGARFSVVLPRHERGD